MSLEEAPTAPAKDPPPPVFATREESLVLSGTRQFDTVIMPAPFNSYMIRSLLADEEVMIANYPYDKKGLAIEGKERYIRAIRIQQSVVHHETRQLLYTDEDVQKIALWPEPLMDTLFRRCVNLTTAAALPLWAKN